MRCCIKRAHRAVGHFITEQNTHGSGVFKGRVARDAIWLWGRLFHSCTKCTRIRIFRKESSTRWCIQRVRALWGGEAVISFLHKIHTDQVFLNGELHEMLYPACSLQCSSGHMIHAQNTHGSGVSKEEYHQMQDLLTCAQFIPLHVTESSSVF